MQQLADDRYSGRRLSSLRGLASLFDAILHKSGNNLPATPRRGGREAEGGGLLTRCRGQHLYRGFEAPPLRQLLETKALYNCCSPCYFFLDFSLPSECN